MEFIKMDNFKDLYNNLLDSLDKDFEDLENLS